ncbi:N-acetylmannosamine-6-phosphate 2-epimerase [Christensenellaceae bacterium OttesenSCG-928-M15]|nr:N-acetylmannosamine-6-phosphate 2-epimerase [Christensenellaceae bacterium OttesenSCG-928-M15]
MNEKMENAAFFDRVRGGLIVSCQALPEEPLHGSETMAKMARAAMLGGAACIRANTPEDIRAIRSQVDLPVIGIIKRVYPNCDVYITPTMAEVDALYASGVEVIAMDATNRPRPAGQSPRDFFSRVREKYADQLFMADCATVEEGLAAAEWGFDIVATTMAGYTPASKEISPPAFEMMEALVKQSGKPVIAEGGIFTEEQLKRAMDTGVLAAVIGTAITRPMEITRRFVRALVR